MRSYFECIYAKDPVSAAKYFCIYSDSSKKKVNEHIELSIDTIGMYYNGSVNDIVYLDQKIIGKYAAVAFYEKTDNANDCVATFMILFNTSEGWKIANVDGHILSPDGNSNDYQEVNKWARDMQDYQMNKLLEDILKSGAPK